MGNVSWEVSSVLLDIAGNEPLGRKANIPLRIGFLTPEAVTCLDGPAVRLSIVVLRLVGYPDSVYLSMILLRSRLVYDYKCSVVMMQNEERKSQRGPKNHCRTTTKPLPSPISTHRHVSIQSAQHPPHPPNLLPSLPNHLPSLSQNDRINTDKV